MSNQKPNKSTVTVQITSPSLQNDVPPSSSGSTSWLRIITLSGVIGMILAAGIFGFHLSDSAVATPQERHFSKLAKAKKSLKRKGLLTSDGACRTFSGNRSLLIDGVAWSASILEQEILCSPCSQNQHRRVSLRADLLQNSNNNDKNIKEDDEEAEGENKNGEIDLLNDNSSSSSSSSSLIASDEVLKSMFSTNTLSWDRTTAFLIQDFKNSIVNSKDFRNEYFSHGKDFVPPCNLQNSKLQVSSLSDSVKFTQISILDYLRLYRNHTVGELFELEKTPVVCLLSLLHTGNCRPEEESLQRCVVRLGLRNIEAILPEWCVNHGFWKTFVSTAQIEKAEAKYLKTLEQKWKRVNNKNKNKNAKDDNKKSQNSKEEINDQQQSETNNKFKAYLAEREHGWQKLKRGVIPQSTCRTSLNEIQEFIPPSQRNPMKFGDPLFCANSNISVNQIGFSVPRSTVVEKVARTKVFDFMPAMPGAHLGDRGYKVGLQQELVFRELYTSSYFSFSNARGGVDCFRHVEILGSGSVPYFPEIETVAKHSVGYLPKELLKKVLTLPGLEHIGPVPDRAQLNLKTHEFYEPIHQHHIHFKKRGWINVTKFNVAEYYRIADALLEYTKKYLTCGSMVASILKRLGEKAENARNVLVVSRFEYDYLHQMVHVGLSELGIPFTVVGEDSTRWSYRQKACAPLSEFTERDRAAVLARLPYLYANGLGVPVRAFNGDHNIKFETKRDSPSLKADILSKKFDAVIYSYIWIGMSANAPYLADVKSVYAKNEVAFLDHEDANFAAPHEYRKLDKIGTIFARELDERRSCI